MAATSKTVNYDALLTTTLDNYRQTMTDNIIASSVLLSAIKASGGYVEYDGGDEIKVPLMYGKTPVASYGGYDTLDTTPTDGITSAFFPWRQLSTPIAISRIEERKNSGQARLFGLLEAKIKQAEMSITEEVNLQLLGKTVSGGAFISGNDTKDLDPLALLIPKDPTSSTTIGRINQSNESWWRSRSVHGDSTGATSKDSGAVKGWDITSFATFEAALRGTYNYCSRGAGGSPNMIITDQAGFELFEASLASKTRYTQQSKGTLAFDNIMFKQGTAMYWDEQMPDMDTGVAYDSSSYATSNYFFLNTKFIQFIVDSQTNFITTPFVRPENQDAKVAHIMLYGNLVCSQRRKQGLLYGVDETISS
jgi:hypothetical protein